MSYTSETIFKNKIINGVLDLLMRKLDDFSKSADPAITLADEFCLTGRAAAILQGEPDTPVDNVIFITSSAVVMEWLKTNLATFLKAQQIVKFKTKILIYYPQTYIEIHYTASALNIVDADTLRVQNKTDIPSEFL